MVALYVLLYLLILCVLILCALIIYTVSASISHYDFLPKNAVILQRFLYPPQAGASQDIGGGLSPRRGLSGLVRLAERCLRHDRPPLLVTTKCRLIPGTHPIVCTPLTRHAIV